MKKLIRTLISIRQEIKRDSKTEPANLMSSATLTQMMQASSAMTLMRERALHHSKRGKGMMTPRSLLIKTMNLWTFLKSLGIRIKGMQIWDRASIIHSFQDYKETRDGTARCQQIRK